MADEKTPEEIEEIKKAEEGVTKEKEKQAALDRESYKTQQEINRLLRESDELEQAGNEKRREALKQRQKKVDEARKALAEAIKNNEATDELVKKLREANKEYDKQTKYIKTIDADADQILTSFFGITSQTKQFAKTLEQGGGLSGVLKDRISKVREGLTLSNIQAKLIQKSFENITKLSKSIGTQIMKPVAASTDLTSTIEKATQRQDEFRLAAREVGNTTAAEIDSLSEKFMRLGKETDGTTEDFIKINKTMFNTSAVFRSLKQANDSSREALERTAQTLERRFNVSVSDVAKTTDILGRTFGMTATETSGFQESLVATFDAMGLDGKRALSDFASQSNNLAKFNLPDLKQEFTGLAAIAEKTGISIDSMMGSLDKFTTFEGALTGAANLNAVFGTTIDGMELMDTVMTKGPIAGFIKLRETLEASGIQIDKLNFAQMRQLSSTLGMSAEQMRAFGNVSSDTLQNLAEQGLSAAEVQEKLNDGRKEGQTTEEKMAENIDDAATNMNKVAKAIDDATRSVSNLISGFENVIGVVKTIGGLVAGYITVSIIKATGKALGLGKALAAAAASSGAGGAVAGGAGKLGMLGRIGGMALGGKAMLAAGALYGTYKLGEYIADNTDFFASGQNYVSKPTIANVGEVGAEMITSRTQRLLQPGSSVTRTPSSGMSEPTNLTINLVGSEGKIFDTSSREISQDQMDKAISHYLNTKVSLLNS